MCKSRTVIMTLCVSTVEETNQEQVWKSGGGGSKLNMTAVVDSRRKKQWYFGELTASMQIPRPLTATLVRGLQALHPEIRNH